MKKIILTQLIFLVFLISAYAQSWKLTGNAGTNPASNFLGTTDAKPMVFRVNNQRAGYIDYDTTKGLTSFGYRALFSNSGVLNTAFGYQALFSNTIGNSNTAIGFAALYSNTKGIHNVAIGQRALYSNTEGHRNIAIGYEALTLNTTGITCTAVGDGALSFNTNGYSNVAVGFDALLHNTTGFYNAACGNNTLLDNTIGKRNTAIGWSAGSESDSNNYCTFVGYNANQTGSKDFNNSMALGNAARITDNNQVRVGNISITSIGGQVDWTTLSDGRYKKDLKENVPGLQFINKLKPVTYYLDVAGVRTFLGESNKANDDEEKNINNNDKAFIDQGINEKGKILYTGFVAQEVEKAAKEISYDFSGVDKPQNENSLYGLRYAEFVVPLVKAVQELSQQNTDLKNQNEDQQKKIDGLQKQIDDLRALVISSANSSSTSTPGHPRLNDAVGQETSNIAKASLQQNIPNPFNHTTTINYTLPQQYSSAKITITDKSGKNLKEVNLSGSSNGSWSVDASAISSGAYQYSLYVDSKLIDTKQMLLSK